VLALLRSLRTVLLRGNGQDRARCDLQEPLGDAANKRADKWAVAPSADHDCLCADVAGDVGDHLRSVRRAPADQRERGIQPIRAQLADLPLDLGLDLFLVGEEREAGCSAADEDFLSVNGDEPSAFGFGEPPANGSAPSAVSDPSVAQMIVLNMAASFSTARGPIAVHRLGVAPARHRVFA
jgi:hypothetical protein